MNIVADAGDKLEVDVNVIFKVRIFLEFFSSDVLFGLSVFNLYYGGVQLKKATNMAEFFVVFNYLCYFQPKCWSFLTQFDDWVIETVIAYQMM